MLELKDLGNYLVGVVIGIRFRANFSVEDQLGAILDTILYSKNSFFTKRFTNAQSIVGKKVLINERTNDSLSIDNSNIILEINFTDDKDGFQKDQVPLILQKIDEQIIKGVMKEFAIKEIQRVGYIKRYIFPLEDLAKSFVSKTIGNTLDGVNEINLNFSKKLPVSDGLVKRGVDDYNNVIFNIMKQPNLNEIFIAVDYQSYYHPFLTSSNEIEFHNFIKQSEDFNNGRYLSWLNNNYGVTHNER